MLQLPLAPAVAARLLLLAHMRALGSKGSGNYGHAGRPGKRGGSASDPSGTRSDWTPEKGGMLYHGTSQDPKSTLVRGALTDTPMFLTTEYQEAQPYAVQVHRFGARPTSSAHVIRVYTRPGKAVNADKEVASALEEGGDPERAALAAGRKASADYVTYTHPSNVLGKKEEQQVVIALNPRKSLSYDAAWSAHTHRALGSARSGNWGHAGRRGKKGGSAAGSSASRAERALSTYKPSTRATQQLAARSVNVIARFIGGEATDDHKPMDIIVGRHGIEVKTLIRNTTNQITMHKDSLARKKAWVRKNGAIGHTIVVDRRATPPVYYYSKGFGSFRLQGLQRTSLSQLKKVFRP